jgi:hypothetical protein
MRALGAAALAGTLWVAALEDRLVLAGARPEDDPLFRTAVTVNKFACSLDAGLVVHHAIEILGGNGTIEDFSPLPRLWREVPVQESWEGPHNTLMAQVLRDGLRSKMHDALLGACQELLLGVRAPALAGTRDRALGALDDLRGTLATLLRGDPDVAALHLRALVTRMARLAQVALLLEDAGAAQGEAGLGWLGAAAELLLDRWVVRGYEPVADATYPALVRRVLGD